MKDSIDGLIDSIHEELENLATLKEKRQGLLLNHKEIAKHVKSFREKEEDVVRLGLAPTAIQVYELHTKYDTLFEDGNAHDVMYGNMRTYLKDVIEHLKVYKVEKKQMRAQMEEMEKNMKIMDNTSLSLINKVTVPPHMQSRTGGGHGGRGKKKEVTGKPKRSRA